MLRPRSLEIFEGLGYTVVYDRHSGRARTGGASSARGTCNLFKTCHVWTARAPRSGGCPLTPFVSVTAGDVIDQATAFCGAIRLAR